MTSKSWWLGSIAFRCWKKGTLPMKMKEMKLYFRDVRLTTIVFFFLLLSFMGFAMFFAVNLNPGIIPDEPAHLILSEHFSTTLGIPPDVPETYSLGYIGHKPFLYYWLNGRFLNVVKLFIPNISEWKQFKALRVLNVLYSTLAVIFCYLISKEVFENPWWRILVTFLLINTLMFAFLSGGVNYDNLINFLAFAGIYFLLRTINEKPFFENSIIWLIFISAGTLVHQKVLPLALITVIVWILYVVKNRRHIDFSPKWTWKLSGLVAVLIVLFVLNLSIWGINLIKYRALRPSCNEILTEDQCNLSPFVARSEQLNLPKKLTLVDVVEKGYPDPLEYVWNYWTASMLSRIYGIMGHKHYFPDLIITFYRLLITWVIFMAIRYWKKNSYLINGLLSIFVFYLITLLAFNYNNELVSGFKHVAIQGRYIFPVISIAYVLIVYYISQIRNIIVQRVTVLYTILLFLWGSPFVFIFIYSSTLPGWFN